MTVPKHIGIILDGNRRYAKKRMMPAWMGHTAGSENVDKLMDWCKEYKIKELTLYTFSMENFSRPKKEVNHLMKLFKERFRKVTKEEKKIMKEGVRINFIGRKSMFPKALQNQMLELEKKTKKNKRYILNFAMGYSGREEIVDAVKLIAKDVKSGKIKPAGITEMTIQKHLYLKSYPDLIIRTAGEQRLSNFLTFQSAYSELIFVDKFWPDFKKADFAKCLREYAKRARRFGK